MNTSGDIARNAKAYGHVTPQGIAYSWCGRGIFMLHPEPCHTNREVREAKQYLTKTRNAQQFTVSRVRGQ